MSFSLFIFPSIFPSEVITLVLTPLDVTYLSSPFWSFASISTAKSFNSTFPFTCNVEFVSVFIFEFLSDTYFPENVVLPLFSIVPAFVTSFSINAFLVASIACDRMLSGDFKAPFTWTFPEFTVVSPVNVLCPDKIKVPSPFLIKPASPEISFENIDSVPLGTLTTMLSANARSLLNLAGPFRALLIFKSPQP